MTLFDTVRERFGIDPREFTGATFAAEIPVSTAFVNRIIAERLARHAQIASVQVEPQADDAVAIRVEPRARMVPALTITARIERQPEFPTDPSLHLRWSMPAAGPLAMLAAPALSYFKAMPSFVRLEGDRVRVDIGELLRARGQGDVIGLIRRAAIHSRPGGFVLQIEAAI